MTLLLKQLFAFFKLLNSDTGTNQLALGLAFGLVLGFSPILSLQALLVIFCCFFFRIQLGAAFLSAFFFKFVAYVFDPVSDYIGRNVLESQSLRPLFTTLYNAPLVPLTRFNDSIVMGSAIISLALVIPLFFAFKIAIFKYREQVVARYKQSKIWKAWAGTSFYKWYSKYNDLYGA
ncbi:MAG: DUF2062 domain-containing protein [Bdellovibrio sp. CG10_big_fil_rev_8_21_14_0_10_47_8]|nr:MAG: DUF2062 domain-containing protein [Bdellovibrio sp. CG10_big_fil_rev_8_21_14_0_10_47_8]